MSDITLLNTIYKIILDRDIDPHNEQDHINTHRLIFILNSVMGIGELSEYKFVWMKNLTFSDEIQDILSLTKNSNFCGINLMHVNLDKKIENACYTFKSILRQRPINSESGWIEAICNFYFIKKYMLHNASYEEIIDKLKEISPKLNNIGLNEALLLRLEK